MVENAGNVDTNRLYQLLVDDDISPKPPDGSKKGLAASHKGAVPPAPSNAPVPSAGALPYAPTSGIPAHEYYAALDAASPRFAAAASTLAAGSGSTRNTASTLAVGSGSAGNTDAASVTIYMSPERMMAQAENAALLFTNQQLKDYFETRQQAIKANAGEAKSLARNFRDAADKIAGHAWTACIEAMAVAGITAAVAIYSFSSSGAGEVDDEVVITDDPDVPIPDEVTITDDPEVPITGDDDVKIVDDPDAPITDDDDVKITDDEPEADAGQADAQAADAQTVEAQGADAKAADAANAQAADAQAADARAADAKAADAQAADTKAADAKAADNKAAADTKAASNKAADAKTVDAKTAAAKKSWWDKGFALAPAGAKALDALAGKEKSDGEADQNIAQARGAEITALADAAKAEQSRADGALASLEKQLDGIAQTINDLRKNHAEQIRATTIA
jgi:hypothetical protein